MMQFLGRLLSSRVELQAGLLATANGLTIFNVLEITAEQLAALNLILVAWLAFVSQFAFKKGLDEWAEAEEDARAAAALRWERNAAVKPGSLKTHDYDLTDADLNALMARSHDFRAGGQSHE